jgi:hypothetical protein
MILDKSSQRYIYAKETIPSVDFIRFAFTHFTCNKTVQLDQNCPPVTEHHATLSKSSRFDSHHPSLLDVNTIEFAIHQGILDNPILGDWMPFLPTLSVFRLISRCNRENEKIDTVIRNLLKAFSTAFTNSGQALEETFASFLNLNNCLLCSGWFSIGGQDQTKEYLPGLSCICGEEVMIQVDYNSILMVSQKQLSENNPFVDHQLFKSPQFPLNTVFSSQDAQNPSFDFGILFLSSTNTRHAVLFQTKYSRKGATTVFDSGTLNDSISKLKQYYLGNSGSFDNFHPLRGIEEIDITFVFILLRNCNSKLTLNQKFQGRICVLCKDQVLHLFGIFGGAFRNFFLDE